MISKLTAITPEYMEYRLEQEIERLKELSKVDSQQAQEIIIELKQEIESLREHTSNQDRIIAEANNRIYKAIEYVKGNGCYCLCFGEWGCVADLSPKECDKLLKILEGESE